MFDAVLNQILSISREAWGFLVGVLIIVALLGGLYYVLQGTAGAAFGGSKMAAGAIIGAIALVVLVMFAFLIIPQLGEILRNSTPPPPF